MLVGGVAVALAHPTGRCQRSLLGDAQEVGGRDDGVPIEAVPTPDPVESGDLGEATVLVMLGTDLAGKLLPGALPTADPAAAASTTVGG